jgi:hypothetical protein
VEWQKARGLIGLEAFNVGGWAKTSFAPTKHASTVGAILVIALATVERRNARDARVLEARGMVERALGHVQTF